MVDIILLIIFFVGLLILNYISLVQQRQECRKVYPYPLIVERFKWPPEDHTLLDWMFKELKHLPMSVERLCTEATRSEVKRWLRTKGTININGELGPHDPSEIRDYPIFTLVFFPKGKRKTTYQ